MSYSIRIEIPRLPKLPNELIGRHHMARQREKELWRMEIGYAIPRHRRPPAPLARARVTLTRRSSRQPDADNLQASWKYVIDALVLAGVLKDDSPDHVELDPSRPWEYGKGAIEVEVQEL